MKQNFTDVNILLDKSGSMDGLWSDTIGNFNGFLREQKQIKGDGCFSLVQFDDQYEVCYTALPQHLVPDLNDLTYIPRGSTALVDALCRFIDDTGRRLSALPDFEKPSKVLFVVITDGLENASQKYTRAQLQEKITHQRSKYSWEFIYLGANQDAIMTAASFGIPKGNSFTWQATSAGSATAFHLASSGTRSYKSDGNNSADNLLSSSAPDVQVNVNINP